MNRLRSGGRHFVLHRHEFVFLWSWSVTVLTSLSLAVLRCIRHTHHSLSSSFFFFVSQPYMVCPSFSFRKFYVKRHYICAVASTIVSKATRSEYKKSLSPGSIHNRFDNVLLHRISTYNVLYVYIVCHFMETFSVA